MNDGALQAGAAGARGRDARHLLRAAAAATARRARRSARGRARPPRRRASTASPRRASRSRPRARAPARARGRASSARLARADGDARAASPRGSRPGASTAAAYVAGREAGRAEDAVGPGRHATGSPAAVERHRDVRAATAPSLVRTTPASEPGRRPRRGLARARSRPRAAGQRRQKKRRRVGRPGTHGGSSFTREASRTSTVRAGFLAPGSSPRSRPSPGLSRVAAPFERLRGAGSPATVARPRRLSTCFPITLPQREAP